MARVDNLSSFLTDVADAIREKKGTQDQIPAGNFDTEIKSIETGTKINNQNKDITKNGTYTADEGYTGLGTVIVNVPQTGDVPVKLFKTKEEMNSSTGNVEGDLALVYKNEIQPITEESEFDSCTFPQTVVLKEAFTDDIHGRFSAVDSSSGYFNGNVDMSSSRFRFNGRGDTMIRVQYTSSDGITYTRTDGGEELQEFGTVIKYEPMRPWNNAIGNFMQIGTSVFEGIYIYKNNSWELAPTQLDAISDYVYKKSFYGKNGLESGALAQNISNSFNDANADIYSKIQLSYNDISPRVLTDSDKSIDNKIFIIPVKSDGTPLLDTSNVTNMDSMFRGCVNLTTIPKLDTDNATDMDLMFADCSSLTAIPLLNTSKVTNMAHTFQGCSTLTVIPLLDTSNVTNMVYMFAGCRNLTIIPLLDTSNVTDTHAMFADCSSLTAIPELKTSKVTNMDSMFSGCSNLTAIPLLDTSSATDMSYMFYDCSNLTEIPLLDTSKVTNMFRMFKDCKNLTTISKLNTSNVTNMETMFEYCSNLTTIPQLDTSKVTDMRSMFGGCSNLTTIPKLDTSKVISMDGMFDNCNNLTTIPLLNTSNVTSMGAIFRRCTSLTTIPLLDTSNVTNMYAMFEGCTNLTSIPELNTSKATSISDMFSNCEKLSDDSLNNILAMCINAVKITSDKTLKHIGLTSEQATKCATLSNYSAFTSAGWTTGY